MGFLRELWSDVRDAVLVVAQVVTLGVIAMVLGLLALNAVLGHTVAGNAPPPPHSQPARPLTALVPTLLASTSTPRAAEPPGLTQSTATPTAQPAPPSPTANPPAVPTPPPGTRTPQAAAQATAPPTPRPAPTDTPRPPAPTPHPEGTRGATGQLKVLPAPDGLPARVRAGPTTRAPILVRIPLGSTVEVIGRANGDEVLPGNRTWLRVRWKNTTGWVYSSLIGE